MTENGFQRWRITFDLDVWGDRDPREWDWEDILSYSVGEEPDVVVDGSLTLHQPKG